MLHISLLFLIVVVSLLYSSAWLTGYEHPVIEIINQRIEDLTGLEMDTAEELQVNDNPREPQQVFSPSTAALINANMTSLSYFLYL